MTYLPLNLCWNERESLINMARTEQMILHLSKTLIHVNNDLIIHTNIGKPGYYLKNMPTSLDVLVTL